MLQDFTAYSAVFLTSFVSNQKLSVN